MAETSLASSIGLITATLDLQLVRLIRGAIHAADASAGGGAGCGASAVIEPRFHIHPEPTIEPRQTITPEPDIEPRLVHHPEPRIEPTPPQYAPPADCEHHRHRNSPIQAPWRILPWNQPLPPVIHDRIVKVIRYRPDMAGKGALLDRLG